MDIIKAGFLEKIYFTLRAPRIEKKTNFFRLLAVAQRAWLGIRDALISLLQSETHTGMRLIIDDLIDQLTQWVSFGDALMNHIYVFWPDEIALVKSSEIIGNLPDVLEDIAVELENLQLIQQKIIKSMMYPLILLVFTVVAVAILLVFVVPTIVGMFPVGSDLPAITQFMLSASAFIQATWFIDLILLVGIIMCIHFFYKTLLPFKIFVDRLFISIPIVADVTKTFYMYRFTKLLWQFYKAWLSAPVSLGLMKDIFQNYFYQKKSFAIQKDLENGFSFANAMENSPLFDPILVQIIYVWENTWNIWDVLLKISSYYRTRLDTTIWILMSLIEPILLALVAIVIWLVVASIFLPMADLVNVIQ